MPAHARRVALFGGTFDPLHVGHLAAAHAVLDAGQADEVVFVPAGDPYHKAPARAAGAERWLMAVLGTLDEPRFRVARWDLEREGPSYTLDTLADARRELPGCELSWILGTDAMAGLPGWHRAGELIASARFLVVARAGFDEAGLRTHLASALPDAPADAWAFVPMPEVDVSSSGLRDALGRGEDVSALLPDAVATYVKRYGTYRQKVARP